MIINISDKTVSEKIGNKAKNLSILKNRGFNVPNGIILDSDIYDIIKKNNFIVPDDVKKEISDRIDQNKKYAVRSSGLKEDLSDLSFAGQYRTTLNVSGIDNICQAIIDCYNSITSNTVIAYSKNNNISVKDFKIAVIIQEMINSDISGIAFTINPTSGNDKEIVVELARGLGENIVSGRLIPENYIYNWYENKIINAGKLISKNKLKDICKTFLEIQIYFGYPCDIEFAIKNSKLYILQSRAVTKIMYGKIKDQWTTADFKDGGVSATVCTPYMWSLYEYIWNIEYKKFLHKGLLVKDKYLSNLGDMFFGRPYWNLSAGKIGMAMVPGYKEFDLDNGLGIKITYQGDGVVTKINPRTIINALRILTVNKLMTKKRLKNNRDYQTMLLNTYDEYLKTIDDNLSLKSLEEKWLKLIFNDYLKSEGIYFNQIFINTVGQSIYKDAVLKYIPESEYLNLLAGLSDISHLRPYNNIWEISRKIRRDADSLKYWQESNVEDIQKDILNNQKSSLIPEILDHINNFGYHSDKELDVTFPHYSEDPEPIIKAIKDAICADDSDDPKAYYIKQQKVFNKQLKILSKALPINKYLKLEKSITEMRKMLWWREELRDISTKFYYLIRLYTIKLAKVYVKNKLLNNVEDIWYLKIDDLSRFISKQIKINDLQKIIERNKQYYQSFRNFTSENEIGHTFDGVVQDKPSSDMLRGVGCNTGLVTGKARVIKDLSEIDRLKDNDILVTKFTDTGWTSKFAILSGVVTEYGGVLCHAAIVSREYGIPCVVCAHGAMTKIIDGSVITINGATGEIHAKNIHR